MINIFKSKKKAEIPSYYHNPYEVYECKPRPAEAKGRVAHRGYIYEFIEKDGSHKNDVLVVSSEGRAYDKLISTIMVGDNPKGKDIVPISYNGRKRYIHSELVTFAKRERLGELVAVLPMEAMAVIDEGLAQGLGLKEV